VGSVDVAVLERLFIWFLYLLGEPLPVEDRGSDLGTDPGPDHL
jgi:hypothetical protein